MANIEIQKKDKNNSFWPWILGLLLIVAVAWIAVEVFDNDDPNTEEAIIEAPYGAEDRDVEEPYIGPEPRATDQGLIESEEGLFEPEGRINTEEEMVEEPMMEERVE